MKMNSKVHVFLKSQKNRDYFSGGSTVIILSLLFFLLFSWTFELEEKEEQAMVEIAPPLDFQELNLNDLKVDASKSGSSTANNSPNRKTNNPNKLVSNKTGGDETQSGSQKPSNNPFGNGGTGDNGNGFGNSGTGNGDGNDSRGNGGGTGIARILLQTPSIPQYEINYDCKISLKISLDDQGKATYIQVVKRETNCNSQTILKDVIERVKRSIIYNKRLENAVDYAFFTIKIESR